MRLLRGDARRLGARRRSRPRWRSPGAAGTLRRRLRGTPPRRQLPRQDGHAEPRQPRSPGCACTRQGHVLAFAFLMNDVTLWRGHLAQDRALRALVAFRAPVADPDAPARRRAERSAAPSSSASSPASSSTATPSRSAFSSFEPGALAGDDVVGLLRDRRGHAAAGGEDPLGRLLARQIGQRAGQHERLDPTAARRRAAAPSSSKRRPELAQVRDQLAHRGSASCSWISSATIGPMPGVCGDLLGRRGQQRVDRAQLLREVAPGDLADALDAEREQHARERPLLGTRRSRRRAAPPRSRRGPRARRAARRSAGRSRRPCAPARAPCSIADLLLAEAVDVHRPARDEVLEQLPAPARADEVRAAS